MRNTRPIAVYSLYPKQKNRNPHYKPRFIALPATPPA
jgi:hypothetical protein